MIDKLYKIRYEIFLISQLLILFGNLFLPFDLFDEMGYPIIFFINLLAGVLLFKESKPMFVTGIFLVTVFASSIFFQFFDFENRLFAEAIRLMIILVIYYFVNVEIIKQVWFTKLISSKEIMALISGYICLGFIGFFIFVVIEIISPGSFNGVAEDPDTATGELMYFSYITLLTIGYGEITPATEFSRNASILIGLVGQIYIAIVTGTIVGKFVNQLNAGEK